MDHLGQVVRIPFPIEIGAGELRKNAKIPARKDSRRGSSSFVTSKCSMIHSANRVSFTRIERACSSSPRGIGAAAGAANDQRTGKRYIIEKRIVAGEVLPKQGVADPGKVHHRHPGGGAADFEKMALPAVIEAGDNVIAPCDVTQLLKVLSGAEHHQVAGADERIEISARDQGLVHRAAA